MTYNSILLAPWAVFVLPEDQSIVNVLNGLAGIIPIPILKDNSQKLADDKKS